MYVALLTFAQLQLVYITLLSIRQLSLKIILLGFGSTARDLFDPEFPR